MKSIQIIIMLHATLSLIAMEHITSNNSTAMQVPTLQEYTTRYIMTHLKDYLTTISTTPPCSTELLLQTLSEKNYLLNHLEVDETGTQNPTVYNALNQIQPETTFRADINDTAYITIEPDGYGPTSFSLILTSREKSAQKKLLSCSEARIQSFALSSDKQEIAVGREDGTISLFDIKSGAMLFERQCSYDSICSSICSIVFDTKNSNLLISSDEQKVMHLLHKKNNVIVSIKNEDMPSYCPSAYPEAILSVQRYTLNLSPSLPYQFLNRTFSDPDRLLLLTIAHLKGTRPSLSSFCELTRICDQFASSDFAPPIKAKLTKIMERTASPRKRSWYTLFKTMIITVIGYLKKREQWYTYIKHSNQVGI